MASRPCSKLFGMRGLRQRVLPASNLHPHNLEYLGIAAAIRGFCKDFATHEISIEFTHRNASKNLPRDVSLCLFRVPQEALHNAVKYSGVNQYWVELRGLANEEQLVARDAAAGFEVHEAMRNRGLGLVSMQERVHCQLAHVDM
jgi:signal transduction histidine kinase